MSQAIRTVEIAVSPEQFYDVLIDFERYSDYLGDIGLVENRVIHQSETAAEVESTVKKMGAKVQYTLSYKLSRPNKLEWSFVKGNMMKDNRGSWELEQTDSGHTRATYTIEVSFGWMVPKTIVSVLTEKELPGMLDSFRTRAETLAS